MITMIVDTLPVFYYEKMVGTSNDGEGDDNHDSGHITSVLL